jgi:hypothetical protein
MPILLTECAKIVRNEILHVQCIIHNALIPFRKPTGRFKSEHPVNMRDLLDYLTLAPLCKCI